MHLLEHNLKFRTLMNNLVVLDPPPKSLQRHRTFFSHFSENETVNLQKRNTIIQKRNTIYETTTKLRDFVT